MEALLYVPKLLPPNRHENVSLYPERILHFEQICLKVGKVLPLQFLQQYQGDFVNYLKHPKILVIPLGIPQFSFVIAKTTFKK